MGASRDDEDVTGAPERKSSRPAREPPPYEWPALLGPQYASTRRRAPTRAARRGDEGRLRQSAPRATCPSACRVALKNFEISNFRFEIRILDWFRQTLQLRAQLGQLAAQAFDSARAAPTRPSSPARGAAGRRRAGTRPRPRRRAAPTAGARRGSLRPAWSGVGGVTIRHRCAASRESQRPRAGLRLWRRPYPRTSRRSRPAQHQQAERGHPEPKESTSRIRCCT